MPTRRQHLLRKRVLPIGNQTAQLLNTAGILAVGFLVWPLGGWMFGRYADRFGRRLKCANRSRSLRTLWSSQEYDLPSRTAASQTD